MLLRGLVIDANVIVDGYDDDYGVSNLVDLHLENHLQLLQAERHAHESVPLPVGVSCGKI